MASYDWRLEMENMLAAFNRQAIHSLGFIELAFKRSGLLFTPEFKKYFVQSSTNCVNEAYDRFQVSTLLEKQLNPSLNSVANVSERSTRNGPNGVECETDDRENDSSIGGENGWITNASDSVIPIDDSGYDEVVIKANETKPIHDTYEIDSDTISIQSTYDTYDSNDSPIAVDDLHQTDARSIVHESKTKESNIIAAEIGNESNLAVESDDSNDSIEMVENQSDSANADDEEPTTVKVFLDRLDETAIPEWAEDKSKTTPLNHNRDNLATNGEKSTPKRSIPNNKKECTICGYVGLHMGNLNRHMRTHTGERPYGCDRCGKRFTCTQTLTKHAATHIAEFPFHCRACFHGFASKAEVVAHEKQCQKRRYECHICKQCVTCNKNKLIIHMQTHTGDKPFRCEICTKHFGHKQNLKKHLNIIHLRR